jgi:mannose-6-phosphate isomerase-like protein (cupin superfamily)
MFVSGKALIPIDFPGLRIFDYTAGHDLSASLALIDVPAGGRHAEVWSKRSDKYCVVAGAIRFTLDGEETELATGDFCLVPQGARFSYSTAATAPASHMCRTSTSLRRSSSNRRDEA